MVYGDVELSEEVCEVCVCVARDLRLLGYDLRIETRYRCIQKGWVEVERRLAYPTDAAVGAKGHVYDESVACILVLLVHRLVPDVLEQDKSFFLGHIDRGAEMERIETGGCSVEVRGGADDEVETPYFA